MRTPVRSLRGQRITARSLLILGASVGLCLLSLSLVFAQSGWELDWRWSGRGWWNRMPPKFPALEDLQNRDFSFCRVLYQSVRDEPLGHGWNTDYPDSDINFMIRFSQLTTTNGPPEP